MSKKLYVNLRFLEEGELTGVGRFGYEISKRLQILRNDITFIGPPTIPQKWIKEFEIITFGKAGGALWEQTILPLYLWNKKGKLLNLANTSPIFCRLPSTTVIHDIIPLTNPEWYSSQAKWYYRVIMPLTIKRSSHIITVSNYTKKEILERFNINETKISVVYNAASVFWKPSDRKPTFENYILTVASFDPRKNLEQLIHAFRKLTDKAIKLVIVGHKHKAFKELNISLSEDEKSRIIFTGYVDDETVRSLYSFASLFIFPSLKEGFGIPPLEAMACCCPVIASNRSSIPEVCGDAAAYFDPENSDIITNVMSTVLKNSLLQKTMKEKGKARAECFSWENSALKMSDVLNMVAC